ncbi:hypothetical protein F5884DRAFT_464299 [Xylogone sp. PMI_703]|nr:hypothetical protein F5884DRAFT_464299 [Xylogone sp. PMI_703]
MSRFSTLPPELQGAIIEQTRPNLFMLGFEGDAIDPAIVDYTGDYIDWQQRNLVFHTFTHYNRSGFTPVVINTMLGLNTAWIDWHNTVCLVNPDRTIGLPRNHWQHVRHLAVIVRPFPNMTPTLHGIFGLVPLQDFTSLETFFGVMAENGLIRCHFRQARVMQAQTQRMNLELPILRVTLTMLTTLMQKGHRSIHQDGQPTWGHGDQRRLCHEDKGLTPSLQGGIQAQVNAI